MSSTTVDRQTMLKLAYAQAAASVGLARQAEDETDELLSLVDVSINDVTFAPQRDAAERIATLWERAARDLAILEAVRGLSDPATWGEDGPPAVEWYGTRRDMEPIVAAGDTDLAPSQVDIDPA
ncbi:MAG: hypothetical protein IT338_12095 [Thermomicrobiales bacterium]|nr:hypothetical protein [Thermomicrobiales bacterium]